MSRASVPTTTAAAPVDTITEITAVAVSSTGKRWVNTARDRPRKGWARGRCPNLLPYSESREEIIIVSVVDACSKSPAADRERFHVPISKVWREPARAPGSENNALSPRSTFIRPTWYAPRMPFRRDVADPNNTARRSILFHLRKCARETRSIRIPIRTVATICKNLTTGR